MNIKMIKLVNGEEIIGDLQKYEEKAGCYLVKDPLVIVEKYDVDKGSKYWGLAKYLQYSKDNMIWIADNGVIYMSDVIDEIEEYYLKQLVVHQLQSKLYDDKEHISEALEYIDSLIVFYTKEQNPTDADLQAIENESKDESDNKTETDNTQLDEMPEKQNVYSPPKKPTLH